MAGSIRQFTSRAGDVLFRPGQDCPGFVELRAGTIRVSLTAPNGREVVLYRVKPGDLCLQTFSCLIDGRTYTAEGIAETDLDGRIIPPERFRDQVATDPAFRDLVFGAVARRFSDFEQLVEDVALTGFDARLARCLLRLRDGDGLVHRTHDQLAGETASGRAFVSRRLGDLSKRGLVKVSRGQIRLSDIRALEQLAADSE